MTHREKHHGKRAVGSDPKEAPPAEFPGQGGDGAHVRGEDAGRDNDPTRSMAIEEVVPVGEPVEKAVSELTELEEQRDKYLRLAAEYDNYRRRTQRERLEAGGRAQADLVKQLVDPLDDLSRFAHVDPAAVDGAAIVQGVEMVERKIMKSLGAAGLQVINPLNQMFDPALHEAVATEPALSPEDDHVVSQVYQPGYVFNGQLLRPARVVVHQWNG
jgi:molecular chaperone GrpE